MYDVRVDFVGVNGDGEARGGNGMGVRSVDDERYNKQVA